VVKVFVCANSSVELARLEALVKSALSLRLVGSSLGRAGLDQQLAETQPDVLLERPSHDDLVESNLSDFGSKTVARVLLVNGHEFSVALTAFQTGHPSLRGVLPNWASQREIQTAIQAAAAGLVVLHPDVAEFVATASSSSSRVSSSSLGQQLSPRESEILNMLAAGLGNKEIAWRLKISEHTVKFHVTSIFNKLNASNRAEAVAVGVRLGLIIL
jgi:NarL family two-component system response regulator YdfI